MYIYIYICIKLGRKTNRTPPSSLMHLIFPHSLVPYKALHENKSFANRTLWINLIKFLMYKDNIVSQNWEHEDTHSHAQRYKSN